MCVETERGGGDEREGQGEIEGRGKDRKGGKDTGVKSDIQTALEY